MKLYKIFVFFGIISIGSVFINNSKVEATQCWGNQNTRENAQNVTRIFPRSNFVQTLNGVTCGSGSGDQYIFLSSFYNVYPSPGSASLQTGTVELNLFYLDQSSLPPSSISIRVDKRASNNCSAAEVATFNGTNYNQITPGLTDGTAFNTITFNTNWGTESKYGNLVRVANRKLRFELPNTAGTQLVCPIRLTAPSGVNISFVEDSNNAIAHDQTLNNEFNLDNWRTRPKRYLGPARASNGSNPISRDVNSTNRAQTLYSDTGSNVEYALPFASPCDLTNGKNVYLRIYDMDNPNAGIGGPSSPPFQGPNPRMRLYDDTTSGSPTLVPITQTTGNLSGNDIPINISNDQYRDYSFRIEPGRKYTWVFYNIQGNNGIQIWMPYSEILTDNNASCGDYNYDVNLLRQDIPTQAREYTVSQGSTFSLSSNVVNNGNIRGPNYSQAIAGVNDSSAPSSNGAYAQVNANGNFQLSGQSGGTLHSTRMAWTWTHGALNAGTERIVTMNVAVSATAPVGTRQCFQGLVQPNTSTDPGVDSSGVRCFTVVAPPPSTGTVSCSAFAETRNVSVNFRPGVRVNNGTSSSVNVTSVTYQINTTPQISGLGTTGTINANSSSTYNSAGDVNIGAAGNYTITWSIQSSAGNTSCTTSVTIDSGGGGPGELSCSAYSTNPSPVTNGVQFNASVQISNSSSSTIRPTSIEYQITGVGSPQSVPVADIPGSGNHTFTTGNINLATGNYTITWNVQYPIGQSISGCSTPINVAGQPASRDSVVCTPNGATSEPNVPFKFSVTVSNTNPSSTNPITINSSQWAAERQNGGYGASVSGGSGAINGSGGGVILNGGQSATISTAPIAYSTAGEFNSIWSVNTSLGFLNGCGITGTIPTVGTNVPDNSLPPDFTKKILEIFWFPYSRVYGNDVIAGAANGCSAPFLPSVDPVAQGRGSFDASSPTIHGSYKGSAVELAIFAANQIHGVLPGSQINRANTAELAFANFGTSVSVAPSALNFGGGFNTSASSHCLDEYWDLSSAIPLTNLEAEEGASRVDLTNLGTGTYHYSGQIRLVASGGIPANRKITIYVDGTTILGSHTNFYSPNRSGSAYFTGQNMTLVDYGESISYNSYANIAEIPLLQIITRGNIYVDRLMSNIDGLYIAIPTATNPLLTGEIHTCSAYDDKRHNALLDASSYLNGVDIYRDSNGNVHEWSAIGQQQGCKFKLTVNGSFISKKTFLQRVHGTKNNSISFEGPDALNIAEVFNFSPELYLALLRLSGTPPIVGGGGTTQYDSITSPPPAF